MLKLNNVALPSYVKVTSVQYSVLPPVKNNTLSVRGRKGVFFYGKEYETRTITVSVAIHGDTVNGIAAKVREFAAWLNHDIPVNLHLPDDTKYYKVLVDGSTDVEELVRVGKTTITFVCTEPYAFGVEKTVTFTPTSQAAYYFDVSGNVETYPDIELTVKENLEQISVIADNGYVQIGEDVDVEKEIVNPFPKVLEDNMSTYNGWTTATSIENGVISGSYISDGDTLVQSSNNYGTGSMWHGASAIKSLPKELDDFEVRTVIRFSSNNYKEIGRIQVYLLDKNNVDFGRVAFADPYKSKEDNVFYARVGTKGSGDIVYTYPPKAGAWNDFYGAIVVGRKANKWYFALEKYDLDTRRYTQLYRKEYKDVNRQYINKLAKVQIHTGAFMNFPAISTMAITHLTVNEYVVLTDTQASYIAEAGDVLLIDTERATIYKNGVPFVKALNPSSTFFNLQKGTNGLSIQPESADVKVVYRERWL